MSLLSLMSLKHSSSSSLPSCWAAACRRDSSVREPSKVASPSPRSILAGASSGSTSLMASSSDEVSDFELELAMSELEIFSELTASHSSDEASTPSSLAGAASSARTSDASPPRFLSAGADSGCPLCSEIDVASPSAMLASPSAPQTALPDAGSAGGLILGSDVVPGCCTPTNLDGGAKQLVCDTNRSKCVRTLREPLPRSFTRTGGAAVRNE